MSTSSQQKPAWVKYAWTPEATEWFLSLPKHLQSRMWLPTFAEVKYGDLDACQELFPSEDFLITLLRKYREDAYVDVALDDDPLMDAILGADHHSRDTWFNWDGLYFGVRVTPARAERMFREFALPFFAQDGDGSGTPEPSLTCQLSLLSHPDLPHQVMMEGFRTLLENSGNSNESAIWRMNAVDMFADFCDSSETLTEMADVTMEFLKSNPEHNRDEGFFVDCLASLTVNPRFPEDWVNEHNAIPGNVDYPVYFPSHDNSRYTSLYPGSSLDAKIGAVPRHPKTHLGWKMWYTPNEIPTEQVYEEGESAVLDPRTGSPCLPFVGFYFETNRLAREMGTDGNIPGEWVSGLVG